MSQLDIEFLENCVPQSSKDILEIIHFFGCENIGFDSALRLCISVSPLLFFFLKALIFFTMAVV